jgi:hypothetical protein
MVSWSQRNSTPRMSLRNLWGSPYWNFDYQRHLFQTVPRYLSEDFFPFAIRLFPCKRWPQSKPLLFSMSCRTLWQNFADYLRIGENLLLLIWVPTRKIFDDQYKSKLHLSKALRHNKKRQVITIKVALVFFSYRIHLFSTSRTFFPYCIF